MHLSKLALFVIGLALLSACQKDEPAPAETKTRFIDEVYTEVDVQTVTYSQANNLQMDVYQPIGDSETNRPVVVLAHGGGFVAGNRSNPTMVRLGNDLAKRGYVAVSLTYRLAPGLLAMLDSNSAVDVVIKALSDSRAAVRFLRKTVAEDGNPYGIDEERIFMGGNSAGAVLAIHMGFLDSNDTIQPFFNTAIQANGGFEGNSGNPGYSSGVKAVFSLAGGIGRTSWIDAGDVPSIHFHGDQDDVVPYGCGDVFSGATGGLDVIDLCGSLPIHNKALTVGLSSTLNTYNAKHVPWNAEADGAPNELFNEVEQKVFDFLFEQL